MHRMRIGSQPWMRAVALWGAVSLIASIQRGNVALGAAASATSTVNAVNTSRSVAVWGGSYSGGGSGEPSATFVKLALTNSTTITATVQTGYGGAKEVPWSLIEFQPGVVRRIQLGTIAVTGPATTNTATITEVNQPKTAIFYSGFTTTLTPGVIADAYSHSYSLLTNATTVTAKSSSNIGGTVATITYAAVEFN